jgi:putative membrane protein
MNGNQETRGILTPIVVIVLVLVGAPVLIMPLMMGGMMVGGMMGSNSSNGIWSGSNWWGWLLMLLFWIALIGGLALAVAWALRRGSSAGAAPDGGQRALELLKERYARGEIDKEQYEQIKRDLATA